MFVIYDLPVSLPPNANDNLRQPTRLPWYGKGMKGMELPAKPAW